MCVFLLYFSKKCDFLQKKLANVCKNKKKYLSLHRILLRESLTPLKIVTLMVKNIDCFIPYQTDKQAYVFRSGRVNTYSAYLPFCGIFHY